MQDDPLNFYDDGYKAALWRGLMTLRRTTLLDRFILLGLLFLTLSFLPIGRTSPGAHIPNAPGDAIANQPSRLGGGVWKPLAVDSDLSFQHRVGTDFFSIYDAGARAIRGGNPYETRAETPPVKAPWTTAYRYLPFPAYIIGGPLSLLPPWFGFAFWVGLNLAMLLGNFLISVGRRPNSLRTIAFIWFAWFPLAIEWYMGQFTFLMATLMFWMADGLVRRSPRGGVFWGASFLLKIYTVAFAIPLLLWGWRKSVAAFLAIGVLGTGLYFLAIPRSADLFFGQNAGNSSFILRERQPYAGAQGVQEAINATIWTASGRSFTDPTPEPQKAWTSDPVFLVCASLFLGYGLLIFIQIVVSRCFICPITIGLLWLLWFFAYADVWEHHYVLIQALLAWWFCMREVKTWHVALVWLFAGAPSLWILFEPLMANASGLATPVGLLYFWQRPLAAIFLAGYGSFIFWKWWLGRDKEKLA